MRGGGANRGECKEGEREEDPLKDGLVLVGGDDDGVF